MNEYYYKNKTKILQKQKQYRLKNIEKFRKKEKENYNKLKQKALNLIGIKCHKCKSINQLELHHLFYVSEYTPSSNSRFYEAIKNPERFMTLCRSCHMKNHRYRKMIK